MIQGRSIESYHGKKDESLLLLAAASNLLTTGTDYEATLNCIAKLLVSSLATWCAIDLVNDDGAVERVAVVHGDPNKAFLARQVLLHHPPKPTAARGVYRVIESGKSILIPVVTESAWARRADSQEHLKTIMELGSSSYMCVPLKARNRIVGAIMMLSNHRTYDEQDLDTAEEIAPYLAMAVDNVLMFRKMQSALKTLETTKAQLIHAEKMSALGVMSAGIAHEINNPLTVVKVGLHQLQKLIKNSNFPELLRAEDYFQKINYGIHRIIKVVRHVQDFSHQSEFQMEILELKSLIESTLSLFQSQLHSVDLQIITALPLRSVYILGDANRLQQVLLHLLVNAKDAIKAKATKSGTIWLKLKLQDSTVQISIQDDGVGIDEHHKNRVFEPFFTTKTVGQGSGLGLSVCHGIIKDHHGVIHIHSKNNEGAQVTIDLPGFESAGT